MFVYVWYHKFSRRILKKYYFFVYILLDERKMQLFKIVLEDV